MVRNTEKYELVISLRKRGFTMDEIAKYCDIAKSTASLWLKNEAFSESITQRNKQRVGQDNAKRLKLIMKTRASERVKRSVDLIRDAETQFKHYQDDPLFIAGAVLYLAEGNMMPTQSIRISSTKMDVHRIFISFALEYLGIDKSKIHFWLLLYPNHSEEECVRKWCKAVGLKHSQFYKNQYVKTASNKKTLHYGVGNTIIGSIAMKQKLICWSGLASQKLKKKI